MAGVWASRRFERHQPREARQPRHLHDERSQPGSMRAQDRRGRGARRPGGVDEHADCLDGVTVGQVDTDRAARRPKRLERRPDMTLDGVSRDVDARRLKKAAQMERLAAGISG